ncbi:hypothetical protein JG687_00011655 [Phytophthora cactorum]|uniref:Uncharacterized protein n=1 Tax=Phytophthora cactorum TaxID=29920 RepID=A0A8T1U3S2_9STRA|nr:hypothetical protein JG687_00011655 [Phytophthora cactorum]
MAKSNSPVVHSKKHTAHCTSHCFQLGTQRVILPKQYLSNCRVQRSVTRIGRSTRATIRTTTRMT